MSFPTKELKFIHITKTAGSSIETVGLEKNRRWGIHHKEYGFWHGLFPTKPNSLKEKYDWFMVVRNPYKRILSEYHFLAQSLGIKKPKIEEFNNFISKWIINASNNKENHPMFGRCGGDHFTEQYKYLDPNINIHILKFENIEEEFNKLMKEYNYNIILNKYTQVSKKIFNLTDISLENIELIKKVYKKDFELFGYSSEITDYFVEQKDTKIENPLVPVSTKKELKYIPISRNANSFILKVASELNLKWGENHKEYGWRFEKFTNKPDQLKLKHAWLMVVRDPYTRILSEYSFLKASLFLNTKHTVDDFNRIIEKWISNVENNNETNNQFGKKIGDHFTEQYKYYDETAKIHLVKYENLQEDINTVLQIYGYNSINTSFKVETDFPYSIDDISFENIKLINRVYKKDFELFNYEIQTVEENSKKQLKYIHITRTGGTSIEQVGLDMNKLWGRYDRTYGIFDEPFMSKQESLKRNYDWFTVVRNPYTRIISEYNYLKVVLRLRNADDNKTFNSYIEKWLSIIKNKSKQLIHGYHLMPQVNYIDKKYNITILKFENLTEDFNKLMSNYNYSIKLNKVTGMSNKFFTVKDLSDKNIELIKEVYKDDFITFAYSTEYSS